MFVNDKVVKVEHAEAATVQTSSVPVLADDKDDTLENIDIGRRLGELSIGYEFKTQGETATKDGYFFTSEALKDFLRILEQKNKELNDRDQKIKTQAEENKVMRKDVDEMKNRLDNTSTFVTKLALPTLIGTCVFRTQFDQLAEVYKGHALNALRHMKVMFVMGFLLNNELKIFFCCRNFARVEERIKELGQNNHKMLRPFAICLISHEVNNEVAKLRKLLKELQLPVEKAKFVQKSKSYVINLGQKNGEEIYEKIVSTARGLNFQGYQYYRVSNGGAVNPRIMDYLRDTDDAFFKSTTTPCQDFIGCHVKETANGGYQYRSPLKDQRNDLNGDSYSDKDYNLMRLHKILQKDVIVKEKVWELICVGEVALKIEKWSKEAETAGEDPHEEEP